MNPDEFECAICHKVFKKAWSDQEAGIELREKFGQKATPGNSEMVCDDCYQGLFN